MLADLEHNVVTAVNASGAPSSFFAIAGWAPFDVALDGLGGAYVVYGYQHAVVHVSAASGIGQVFAGALQVFGVCARLHQGMPARTFSQGPPSRAGQLGTAAQVRKCVHVAITALAIAPFMHVESQLLPRL